MGTVSGEEESFDKLDWSSHDGVNSAKVRRLLATVTIPKGEAASIGGRSFWTFRVLGDHLKFAAMGGVLSVMVGRCRLTL